MLFSFWVWLAMSFGLLLIYRINSKIVVRNNINEKAKKAGKGGAVLMYSIKEISRMARRFCSDYGICSQCPVNDMCLIEEFGLNEFKQEKIIKLYEIYYGCKDVTEDEIKSILGA